MSEGRWLFQRQRLRSLGRLPPRRPRPEPRRIDVNMQEATLDELIACVEATIERLTEQHREIPHLTRIALKVLTEAKTNRR